MPPVLPLPASPRMPDRRDLTVAALVAQGGDMTQASAQLGIGRSTIYRYVRAILADRGAANSQRRARLHRALQVRFERSLERGMLP